MQSHLVYSHASNTFSILKFFTVSRQSLADLQIGADDKCATRFEGDSGNKTVNDVAGLAISLCQTGVGLTKQNVYWCVYWHIQRISFSKLLKVSELSGPGTISN